MPIHKQEGLVDTCPVTKEAWNVRAELKRGVCGANTVYHCLTDMNGTKWEKCLEKTLILEGNCPIFTSDGYLDWKVCNDSGLCPNRSFVSNEVYQYSFCFGNNTPVDHTSDSINDHSSPNVIINYVVPILLFLGLSSFVILTAVIIYCRRARERRQHAYDIEVSLTDENTDTKEGETLIPRLQGTKIIGVATKGHVMKGLELLNKKDVKSIFVQGKFGNSVSSTCRSILENFAETKKWTAEQYEFPEIPDEINEHTIMFVYGWFGLWNDDLCSVETAENVFETLSKFIEKDNFKVIIGMRSDIIRQYRSDLNKFESFFEHEIYLDDSNTEKKYSEHFKKNVTDKCNVMDCSCKKLTIRMIREGEDKFIGMPVKINIMANHHNLISKYIGCLDVLGIMKEHFNSLASDKGMKHVNKWIEYICLKGQFSPSKEVDVELVSALGYESKSFAFDPTNEDLKRYIRMRDSDRQKRVSEEEATYVFINLFYYICAFHSLFERKPDLVMTHCNERAIFQLLRPKESKKVSYIEVPVDKNSEYVITFKDRLRKSKYDPKYDRHPLMTEP